jgi:hypothetical protein
MQCRNITSHNSDPLRGVQRADFLSAVNPDVLSLKIHGFTSDILSDVFFWNSIWHILWRFISHSVGALSDILWLWNATNCMQMGGRDCCKIENGCINISWPLWKKAIANGYLVIWVVVWNSGIPEIKLMMTLVDTRLPRATPKTYRRMVYQY